jgi:transposase, IS5 family
MQALIGNILHRYITDAGYRSHNAPPDHKFKVYTSGQKRRVTPQIKREFKRRATMKGDHRMGRNYLKGRDGDRINAVLAAAGYNFSLLLRWFEELLRTLSLILCRALLAPRLI